MIRRRAAANIALIVGAVLTGLLMIEALLQAVSPVELRLRGARIELPYFKRYEIVSAPESRLPDHALHTKNALGFRGDAPPKDFEEHLTVIAVGGSTTECFALGDGLCWPARLGERLSTVFTPFWINNAGIAGHTSHGHIELLRQHVLALRPDAIVFLIGVNDLYFTEFTQTYDTRLAQTDDGVTGAAKDLRRWLAENSMLVSLMLSGYKQWRAKQYDLTGQDLDFTRLITDPTPAEVIDAEVARHRIADHFGYADRLRRLIDMTRDAGVLPILMTQPAAYGPGIDPRTGIDLARLRDGVDGFDGLASWRLLELYNDVMRAVAAEKDAILVDLALDLPKDTTFFLDQVHFTADGSREIAEIAFPAICAALMQHYPEHATGTC